MENELPEALNELVINKLLSFMNEEQLEEVRKWIEEEKRKLEKNGR